MLKMLFIFFFFGFFVFFFFSAAPVRWCTSVRSPAANTPMSPSWNWPSRSGESESTSPTGSRERYRTRTELSPEDICAAGAETQTVCVCVCQCKVLKSDGNKHVCVFSVSLRWRTQRTQRKWLKFAKQIHQSSTGSVWPSTSAGSTDSSNMGEFLLLWCLVGCTLCRCLVGPVNLIIVAEGLNTEFMLNC